MSFVLDNSVAVAWCFEDKQTPAIMALLDRVLELALRLPLATGDKILAAAASDAGLELLPVA